MEVECARTHRSHLLYVPVQVRTKAVGLHCCGKDSVRLSQYLPARSRSNIRDYEQYSRTIRLSGMYAALGELTAMSVIPASCCSMNPAKARALPLACLPVGKTAHKSASGSDQSSRAATMEPE